MSQNLNEIAAMALIGEFVSVKELLTAAMKGLQKIKILNHKKMLIYVLRLCKHS
jgi:hypothetical protein